MSTMEILNRKLDGCEASLVDLKVKVAVMEGKIDVLTAKSGGTDNIIKYVVTPLLLIVGALVGIKLVV